jgi:non-specific serine/threonine protein kinase/serine/threonine-protein kinase
LQKIGEGGMGEVFEAEQEKPVRRRVALKVIKQGLDTAQVIARFEAERQALALMDHPNIAKVLDAGTTERGRPFFVMEYVKGVRLTEHCDKHRLDVNERLDLFMQVCEGVQHAHQKSVLHRDIKPSNILVTLQDGKPVPKIIDFGLAKAMAQPLTERTLFTELGQLVGTPAYMSPEQAEMSGQNVDTRTDVYSLGAVLYELLSGTPPFDPKQLREAGFGGIVRTLREEEPPKPSTRVSSQVGDLTQTALKRRSEPARLPGQLRGDLDWIIMKTLEKDPARRYQSPSEIAADIRRHLGNEPVAAGPPRWTYRMGKFLRRHRIGVSLAAAALVLLVGFALRERMQAQRIAGEREAAEQARQEAQARAEELEVVTEFQASMLAEIDAEGMGRALFDRLRADVRESMEAEDATPADVESALTMFNDALGGVNATNLALWVIDEQVLSRAVEATEKEFAEQPVVQAALQHSLADTYVKIGLFPQALSMAEPALETRRRVLGDDHPQTLATMVNMGRLLYEMGRYDDASAYLTEALEGLRRVQGNDHPHTLNAINNMGVLLFDTGRLDEARPYLEEALEVRRETLGDDHLETQKAINNMGALLVGLGKNEEALPYFEETLVMIRRTYGQHHPATLPPTKNIGTLLFRMGKYEEALPYFEETLAGCRRVYGDDHPRTLFIIGAMGSLFDRMGEYEKARPYFVENLERARRVFGHDHPRTLESVVLLGDLLVQMGKEGEAIALLEPAEAAARQAFTGANDDDLGLFLSALGRSRAATAAFEAAQVDLSEAWVILREAEDATLEDRENALTGLIELYESWHATEPDAGHDKTAAEWRAKLAEVQAEAAPRSTRSEAADQ